MITASNHFTSNGLLKDPSLRLIKQKVRRSFNSGESGPPRSFSLHEHHSHPGTDEECLAAADPSSSSRRRSSGIDQSSASLQQQPQPPTQPRRGGEQSSPAREWADGPIMSDVMSPCAAQHLTVKGPGDTKETPGAGPKSGSSASPSRSSLVYPRPEGSPAAVVGSRRLKSHLRNDSVGSTSRYSASDSTGNGYNVSSSSSKDLSDYPVGRQPPSNSNIPNSSSGRQHHSGIRDTGGSGGGRGGNDDVDSIRRRSFSTAEVGLENLGNTCFMNSALQCLLHIQPLVSFFLQPGNVDKGLNLASPKKGVLASSFHSLVQDFYQKKSGSYVSPIHLQRAVGKFAPYLMDYQQQDSQEFLRFLLDGMSEDLCRKYSEAEASTNATSSSRALAAGIDGNGSPTNKSIDNSPSKGIQQHNTHNSITVPILPVLPKGSGSNSEHHMQQGSSKAKSYFPDAHAQMALEQSDQPPHHTSVTQRLREETRQWKDVDARYIGGSGTSPRHSHAVVATEAANSPSKIVTRLRNDVRSGSIRYNTLNNNNNNNNHDEDEGVSDRAGGEVQDDSCLGTEIDADQQQHHCGREGSDSSGAGTVTLRSSTSAPAQPSVVGGSVVAAVGIDGGRPRPSGRRPSRTLQQQSSTYTAIEGEMAQVSLSCSETAAAEAGRNKEPSSAQKEADVAWSKYLKMNDSVVTDIFAGQLQSTIECLTCHHKSSTYDPFLDLSVPIPGKDGEGLSSHSSSGRSGSGRRSFLGSIRGASSPSNLGVAESAGGGIGSSSAGKSTLETCLGKFTAEEMLDGDNMYTCEKCKKKRKSVKRLSIYKYPQVLVIHIKRFRFNVSRREKLSTDVHVPMRGLDLGSFISPDAPCRAGQPPPVYDLIAVCNHHGNLHSGHYTAHVDVLNGSNGEGSHRDPNGPIVSSSSSMSSSHSNSGSNGAATSKWMCFNDSRVSVANPSSALGPSAYVLFYKLRGGQ